MPTIEELRKHRLEVLRGLKASDRTKEEQEFINQQMGYKEKPKEEEIKINKPTTKLPEGAKIDMSAVNRAATSYDPVTVNNRAFNARIKKAAEVSAHLGDLYKDALSDYQEQYGVNRNSISLNANEYIDKISNEVSSYWKKYHGTDKLPDDDLDKKKLAAEYDAKKKVYGEAVADIWLDKQYKNIVGTNQSWWEQALAGAGHLIPAIEGGAIQLLGNTYGLLVGLSDKARGISQNENLSWWNNWINNILDNPITRYGRDVERSGSSHLVQTLPALLGMGESVSERIDNMKKTATKYNPEGIANDAIVTTEDQENSVVNSSTPWIALQSGGFTTLSMIVGAGLARTSGIVFNNLAKGANYLNKTGRILNTTQKLEKALEGIKKAQNLTDIMIVPGLTGNTEGMQEGLNTKIQVEQEATKNLDDGFKQRVTEEANALYNDDKYNPLIEIRDDNGNTLKRAKSREQVFKEVWDKYKDAYNDSRDQIDYASSKAGIYNMWTNSLINGMLNSTLKAGLQHSRVQESLRNSKLFGWAYRKPNFRISSDGTVTHNMGKVGTVLKLLKEPAGEGLEEYLQSLSNDTFAGGAENNITEFVKARFNGDSAVKVGDNFSSDWGAAMTSLYNSLTDKNSVESAVLGAVSSAMGSLALPGRNYHKNEQGNLVQNSFFDVRNFQRGLTREGKQETAFDVAARLTPWRSSVISAYRERNREIGRAEETAEALTEWLKDPKHRAKWDGLVGTASFMDQMHNAAESNDQFSYRNAQMGKAINDAIMLSHLEGTDMYDAIVRDLQRSASMDVNSQEGQSMVAKMRAADSEGLKGKTDEEILDKIQDNANKMLGIMASVEEEGNNIDRLLGRVDQDTKQSLIFGRIMEKDFRERRASLEEQINNIRGQIESSRNASNAELDDELKSLIIRYGSVTQALREESDLKEKKKKAEDRIEQINAIAENKRTDKQKEELAIKQKEVEALNKQLSTFDGLYETDADGERMKDLHKQGLATMVLNEEEIMNLDAITRSVVLAQGATRLYNATHQNRQRVDALNEEIDNIQAKIDALEEQKKQWTTADGKIKKGHNKQVARNTAAIESLEKDKFKKMRELDAETGDRSSKPIYSEAQQAVIDNLIQQGTAMSPTFLDDVVDMGRIESAMKTYHTQYQAILSDPGAFNNYVKRARANMALDLVQRRAERIADIEDFKEFSQELNKLTANASNPELYAIYNTLRRSNDKKKQEYARQQEQEKIDRIARGEQEGQLSQEDGEVHVEDNPTEELETNFDKYMQNQKKLESLISQFPKSKGLTDNDMSLLINAMQYLHQNAIDVTDREKAVEALLEKDDEGNLGGKFRQWVEEKNSVVTDPQRAHMPRYTSIGQIVNQYVEVLNNKSVEEIDRSNANPTIVKPEDVTEDDVVIEEHDPAETPSPTEGRPTPGGAGIFDVLGKNTAESGHFIDGDGTPATGASIEAGKEREKHKNEENTPKTDIEEAFSKVTSKELAKALNILNNLLDSMVFTEDGKNTSLTEEEKALAKQSLIDVAVNSDETFDTMDEIIEAILGKVTDLQKQQDMMQDENDKRYGHAAEVLKSLTSRLKIIEHRRGGNVKVEERANENSSIIHAANIPWMEKKNPYAWAVQFTNKHAIDEYVREHSIDSNTPVYFITNSEWTAEVTNQINSSESSRNYDTLTDMPIVTAIEVETPKNTDNTTAIQVGEKWYQPIGILPSVKSELRTSGSKRTQDIRKLASKEEGIQLVMDNGTSTGNPLITYVIGKKYIDAGHPDDTGKQRDNSKTNNTDVIEAILATLSAPSASRLLGMSKEDRLNDSDYIIAREKVLSRLTWGEGYAGRLDVLNNHPLYTPDDLKNNEGDKPSNRSAQPMLLFTKSLSETTAKESDRTLLDVLENGTLDDIVAFNSRTKGVYNNVIRPLFEHLVYDRQEDRKARVITQEDLKNNPDAHIQEAERLTAELNGYDNNKKEVTKHKVGIKEYIRISPKSGWSIKVTAPSALQVNADLLNSKSVYKVFLVNSDTSIAPVELGSITAQANQGIINQSAIEGAKELLKNFLKESTEGVLKGQVHWQVSQQDIRDLNHKDDSRRNKARGKIGSIIDDGIFELGGSSLTYNNYGLKFKAPISEDGRILYPTSKVTNPSNAKPAAPINNTPQGAGSVQLGNGNTVDEKTGAVLDNPPSKPDTPITPQKSEAEKKAEALTKNIVEDSEQFTLSKDQKYYYVVDKNTGEETKYLRVTTVISADDTVGQWFPSVDEWKNKLGKNFSAATEKALGEIEKSTKKIVGKLNARDEINLELRKKLYEAFEKEGISKEEVNKALAELRAEYNKNKFGSWGIPSTTIGNTADTITRDFFAGELKEHYPNITDEVLSHFKYQLQGFKADLVSKGITIVPNGVVAHGKITVTKEDGSTQDVNVAGTLDLFGYDTKGNFYIFDMKTCRDHTPIKLQNERAKWSRQLSAYRDLLMQSYPDLNISVDNLRIIPINVYYPTPRSAMNLGGPVYSATDEGQLQTIYKDKTEDFTIDAISDFEMRNTEMSKQFQPGYTKLNINWDNLSSVDQEIASSLEQQLTNDNTPTGENEDKPSAPATAEIAPPTRVRYDPLRSPFDIEIERQLEQQYAEYEGYTPPTAPPINNESTLPVLPFWNELGSEAKKYLEEVWGVEGATDYFENYFNDDETAKAIRQELACRGLIR